jgi:hypothetical protein
MVRQAKRVGIWIAVIGVLGAGIYGLSQSSGVAFDEDDIAVVDFSDLNDAQRRTALQSANSARCPCGCGMNLAQCVATDSTCPLRETNIGKIRTLVEQAKGS